MPDVRDTRRIAKEPRRVAFGQALVKLRQHRSMTQADIASMADTSQAFVSLWEKGERAPTPDTVFALERALSLPGGTLSRHLGYYPPDAVKGTDVESAILAHPLLPDAVKDGVLIMWRAVLNEHARTMDGDGRRPRRSTG